MVHPLVFLSGRFLARLTRSFVREHPRKDLVHILELAGKVEGVDEFGALLISDEKGVIRRVMAGDASMVKP